MSNCKNDRAVCCILRQLGIYEDDFIFSFVEDKTLKGISLTKMEKEIKIIFSERVFLFRALGLLKERIDEKVFSLEEKSRFSMNGVMLDCSRNAVANIETLKDIIRQMALMGHNTLMLYTEDTYEVEGEPYFGYMRGRYSTEELQLIDGYAGEFGIELIPCIQTLGHMRQALKWNGVYSNITDSDGILLIGEENTYRFIESMIKACRKAFKSNRIHIGMDEAHFMGRGKYYDKHGDRKLTELFYEHLAVVNKICQKYGFKPMIWGDMPIRQAGCEGYTDSSVDISGLDLKLKMPDDINFIYWDYYSETEERCEEFILAHEKISNNIMFAGSAWRYLNFAPNLEQSFLSTHSALKMCLKHNIKEVFVTLWGDDGNEQSYFTPWPVVQLYAEYNFYDNVSEEHLAKRFNTCTGGIYEDFCTLEVLNYPGSIAKIKDQNPPRYLFYQDVLLGQYDYYVEAGYNSYYDECSKKLRKCEKRAGKYDYIFSSMAALCDVLAEKSELGVRLKKAYDAKNFEEMKNIAEVTIPSIIRNVRKFRDCFYIQWMHEAKIFGFEVMDVRFGGLMRRLSTATDRINAFLKGEITEIPELCEERLPYNGQKDEKAVLSANWLGIISTSF